MPCFGKLFSIGNSITGGSNKGGGLNIGVLNEIRRQMESRYQVMALCGSSLPSNHSVISLLASCL